MMTRSWAFTSLLLLCAAAPTALAGGGGDAGCSQYDGKSGKECCTSDCSPRLFDPAGVALSFDFSSLCKGNYESVNKCEKQWDPRLPSAGGTDESVAQKDAHWAKGEQACNGDWILADKDAHTYSVSFCSHSYWKCLTATWDNAHMYGNVVQYWGATPTRPNLKDACKKRYDHSPDDTRDGKLQHAFDDTNSPTGQEGCTADCQVLALDSPEWTLEEYEKGHPRKGKLTARFAGDVPSRTDPFWCPFDPKTGREEPRSVEFEFICEPSAPAVPKAGATIEHRYQRQPQISVAQNATDDCKFKVTVFTPEACSEHPPPADDVYDDDGAGTWWSSIF